MTILAMLRHAETAWSAQGRIQGRTDVPLSTRGRAELSGRAIPDEFRELQFVTSPLARCTETAALLGLQPARSEHRISEMCWGDWEGRKLAGLRAELGDAMAENEARGMDFLPPGGESPRRVLERVHEWMAEIAAESRSILAVTHRGVIRVAFAAATHWDMRGPPAVKLDWSALHVFRIDPSGVPSVHCLNVPLLESRAKIEGESGR